VTRWDCETAHDHIDARALGALDADDARALDAHLATCPACTALAVDAGEDAAAIALTAPMTASSAALKSRVMGGAAVLARIGPRRAGWWRGTVAAALVLGVGAAAWGAVMQLRVNDLQDRNGALVAGATAQAEQLAAAQAATDGLGELLETQNVVLDVAFQPDAQRIEMQGTAIAPGAWGRCVWSRTESLGAFVVRNMPAAPQGSTYRLWIVYERDWIDAGRLAVDDRGRGQLILRNAWRGNDDWGAFEGFAVTLEPETSTSKRTGQVFLQGSPG
jgi:hypothetical protein